MFSNHVNNTRFFHWKWCAVDHFGIAPCVSEMWLWVKKSQMFTPPPVLVLQSTNQHKSLSVCPNFTKICVHHVTCGQSSVLWRQYNTLCTSRFVDDYTFPQNGANGPESKTTLICSPVCQVLALELNSAISDWILYELSTPG